MDDKDWKCQKQLYKFDKTLVEVISNGKEKRVRKTLKLTPENRNYAKYQLRLMKEITHPHVVKFIDSSQAKDTLTVHMAYYQNMDLQKFLQTHEIDFPHKVCMFIDILSGMMELHSRYIIHRDIKLKNIFVDDQVRCVIGDLGIATKSIDSAKSSVGTIGYNAPEVYSQAFYNEKVDIWALGIIAYQLFNRKRDGQIAFPFKSPQDLRSKIIKYGNDVDYKLYMHFTARIEPLDEDLPAQIREMIQGMLLNDPQKRYNWVDFYRAYHLQRFDSELRLCTFMAEYKMIEDTKETLKEYNNFFNIHKTKYFFKLRHILHHQKIQYFKQRYPSIRDNIIDIHIIHFKLMKKTLDRYNHIHLKRIYKYILQWKTFSKAVKDQIHPIEHRINYKLRSDKEADIRNNLKYMGSDYFKEKLAMVDRILEEIGEEEFKDMKML